MQTILKATLPNTVDNRGGFRVTVNGSSAVLPPAHFACEATPAGKKAYVASVAGREIEVVFTGKSVQTEDAGVLPLVSAKAVRAVKREAQANRLSALCERKYGRPTQVKFIGWGDNDHFLRIEVDGRKAFPQRDPIPVVIMRDQVGEDRFQQILTQARRSRDSKVTVVLRQPRRDGTRIFFEAE